MSNEFKKWFAARARSPDRITLEEAFAAGARSQPAPSVPDGWKLVPIEPTQEMSEAGVFAGSTYYDVAEATYEAMLAAAPKPEAKPCQ